MQDLRQALHAAGIRPRGHDPRALTDDQLDDALVELSTIAGDLQRTITLAGGDLTAYFSRVGAAMRAVAAYVPPEEPACPTPTRGST